MGECATIAVAAKKSIGRWTIHFRMSKLAL
jgi:hypothetical protein